MRRAYLNFKFIFTWNLAYQLRWGWGGRGYLYNRCSHNWGKGKKKPSRSNSFYKLNIDGNIFFKYLSSYNKLLVLVYYSSTFSFPIKITNEQSNMAVRPLILTGFLSLHGHCDIQNDLQVLLDIVFCIFISRIGRTKVTNSPGPKRIKHVATWDQKKYLIFWSHLIIILPYLLITPVLREYITHTHTHIK